MKFNRKIISFILMAFIMVSMLNAQISADPDDAFYTDSIRWEISGLIDRLPDVKPYPLTLVRSILLNVMASDDAVEAEKASHYYDSYFSGTFGTGASISSITELKENSEDNRYSWEMTPFFSMNAFFAEKGAVSLGFYPMLKTTTDDILPAFRNVALDYGNDTADLGFFKIRTNLSAMTSYGSDKIYIQAGYSRAGFGNFPSDSVSVSPKAPQTGNVSFTINEDKWNYSLMALMLTATDDWGNKPSDRKYFYLHSLSVLPFPSLKVTIYESVITGPRFDMLYLIPVSAFMIIQQNIGMANENLQLGLSFQLTLPNNIRLLFDVNADDLHFNDIIKLNLDTRMKFVAQMGLQFVPENSNLLKMLQVDYTMITPYTYSHSQEEGCLDADANYQNYTTRGKSIGTQLMPNSDRLSLSLELEPVSSLRVNVQMNVIRHANVNENLNDETILAYMKSDGTINTSGTVFDFPDAGDGYLFGTDRFMFLNQATKYFCVQNDINLEYVWKIDERQSLSALAGWTFQYEMNKGIDRNIYTPVPEAARTGMSDSDLLDAAGTQLAAWRSSLRHEFSNFITFGIRYKY